jgi:hypothetical protein
MDILESAGTAKAKHFVLAVDDVQKSLEIAQNVKRHFPNVEIIARARNRQHALSLMELGIESIHRETYVSSLEAAQEVLVKKGANREFVGITKAKEQGWDVSRYFEQFPGDFGLIPFADMISSFFGAPTDVPGLEKYLILVGILHKLKQEGFAHVVIDVEPTAGFGPAFGSGFFFGAGPRFAAGFFFALESDNGGLAVREPLLEPLQVVRVAVAEPAERAGGQVDAAGVAVLLRHRQPAEFFQQREEVGKLAQAFNREANELAKVAESGDPAAIKAQFGKTGETCKACHDKFRND